MKVTGIIVEYNPLHNGHIYHINQTKTKSNCDLLIAVMSGNFTQRGEIAILDKTKRAKLALDAGVDVVIELPYFYSTSSADLFSLGAITILNELGVDDIYFGSETNDVSLLTRIANTIDSKQYNQLIKVFLDKGLSYPNASEQALKSLLTDTAATLSNDILGIQYIRSIHSLNSDIQYHSIQRVHNNYNDKAFGHESIASATSIREAVKKQIDIIDYVPNLTYKYLTQSHNTWEQYFDLLKYQIIANQDTLHLIHDINEGFEHAIKKQIQLFSRFQPFISSLTSKRYTESKVKRIMCHILTQFTKDEFQSIDKNYIRILGINKEKSALFKQLIENIDIPVITNISKSNFHYMKTELRADAIYHLKTKEPLRKIPVFTK